MKLYLGIDGGGSKTNSVLADENLNILAFSSAGASSLTSFQPNYIANLIFDLLNQTCAKGNAILENVDSICIGLAGAGRTEPKEKFLDELKILLPVCLKEKIMVETDARIALEGSHGGKTGAILIAGTGSILFHKNESGEIIRVGGCGKILGDEGSGYYIGKLGLQAVSQNYDARIEYTLLTELLKTQFNITNQMELISAVVNDFNPAEFAPLVLSAAENNDKIAQRIVQAAIAELIKHLQAAKIKANCAFNLCCIGGLFNNKFFYASFFNTISAEMPEIKIIQPEYSPEIGAVILAKQKLNIG